MLDTFFLNLRKVIFVSEKPTIKMRKIKYLFFPIVIILVAVIWNQYPRLNIITGFSAKSVCTCTFEVKRDLNAIEKGDNGFSPINLAKNEINYQEKSVTSTVFGLKKRKAIYKSGIGCILLPETSKEITFSPSRYVTKIAFPYPYGNLPPKDTIYNNIDYHFLNKAVENSFDKVGDTIKRTRAVLVLYKGAIIAEKYDQGISKSTKLLGWSMTKSITSAVIGVLENQGKIDVNQRNLFKEWEKDERSKITLNNLLQMNSGLEWNEDYNTISDVTKMLFLSEDMGSVQLNKQFVGEPNESWNYSSGTTNLLSKFIRNQFNSHQEYLDFWYKELIDKIGMNSMILELDVTGNYIGSSYSWATTRDWAKFGQLYLNKGNWNGEQLLSEKWVDYSKTPTKTSEGQYGAQFWLNAGGVYPSVPKELFSCNGYQGQYVFIIPSKDLVIVRLGLSKNPAFNVDRFLSEIVKSII